MANLAHSQMLVDHLQANPQAQQGVQPQQMAQPQPQTAPMPGQQPAPQPQQALQSTPQQETPQVATQTPPQTGGLEGIGQKIMSAFTEIGDFFKQSEQKSEEQVQMLEQKHTEELKGIKDALKQVIES